MKIGIDLGSSLLKTDTGFVLPSKIRQGKSISKAINLAYEGVNYIVGEGIRDVEVNKSKRQTNLLYLYTLLGLQDDVEFEIGLGLPIGQYQQQKEEYKEYILSNNFASFTLNGEERVINITNCKIFAEGLASVEDYEGIILDIGGRTTDIALIENKRVINPISKPKGVLNLYSNIINSINSTFGLDLVEEEAERIIKNGLVLDGEKQDISFIYSILSTFTDDIVNTLKLEYSLRTNNLLVIGGGGALFYPSIKKRVKQAELIQDSLLSNAKGFRRGLGD